MPSPTVDELPSRADDTSSRVASVGGSVARVEQGEIYAAMKQGPFESISDGVRAVLLAYARDAEVRRAVHDLYRAEVMARFGAPAEGA